MVSQCQFEYDDKFQVNVILRAQNMRLTNSKFFDNNNCDNIILGKFYIFQINYFSKEYR